LSGYSDFFTEEEHKAISTAIKAAEKRTSGEIRVHLEDHCDNLPEDRAAYVFDQLEMYKTKDRNAVLFYLAVEDHRFAVVGDAGIHDRVGGDFWTALCQSMEARFRQKEFLKGLTEGIQLMGEHLSQQFPYEREDVNELDDEVSTGKL
jgi:uncharacterized membrane protein